MTDYNEVESKPKAAEKQEEQVEKAERTKKQPVITGTVTKKKKGLVERLVVGLIGPDGIPAVSSYIGKEIIVPAIKNIVVDGITSGINMMMFGGDASPRRGGNQPTNYGTTNYNRNNQTNYARSYQSKAGQNNQVVNHRSTSTRNSEIDYTINDRRDAQNVLNALTESIMDYGEVSVADYLDLIGEEPNYTDNTYGWTDLRTARVIQARGGRGFIVDLPSPSVL
ncbi:MAG: hypothetical protein RR643_04905 [Anaerorhabdus sp.]|uniref:hypothetical protein n=1 Tax=Anaerorhabdus sp. TaxID=1872524 RepID=UPI002FC5C0C3